MGGPNRPRKGQKIAKATWVAEAVRLAIQGWSTRRIAAKVGRHHSTVAEALDKEFERVRPSEAEIATRRGQHNEILDEQIAKWRTLSLKGEPQAATALRGFLERSAKLNGLDAPTRNEHSGPEGGPILSFDMSKLSDEQFERVLAAGELPAEPGDGAGGASPAGAG